MNHYEIPASSFRGALECAAKGDVRYYLNGVLLDAPKGRIVSTRGRILFCGKAPVDKAFPAIIVPREAIEQAIKALGRKKTETTVITVREHDGVYDLCTLVGTFPFLPIDGKFPEYERVIPHKTSGEVSQFDPGLILDGLDALRWYSGRQDLRGVTLSHNGNSGALYSDSTIKALCVIMPLRAGEPSDLTWYTGATPARVTKKVAA